MYAGSIINPQGFNDAIRPAIKAKPNGKRKFEFEKKVDVLPEILRALLIMKLLSRLLSKLNPKYIEMEDIIIEKITTDEK